jgi:hypothetical protein
MESTQITRIYSQLGRLFAQQRRSLLAAASAGFKLEDKEEFANRHALIVRLYEELADLNPAAYRSGPQDRRRSPRSADYSKAS